MDGWDIAYADAYAETSHDGRGPVLPNLSAAREWLHRTIESISSAPILD